MTVVPGADVLPARGASFHSAEASSCRSPRPWAYRDGHDDDRLLRLGRLGRSDPGRGEPGDRRHRHGVPGRRRRGDPAAARLRALPEQPAAPSDQGPAPRRPGDHRALGAVLRTARRGPSRGRPHHPGRRRAAGGADHRDRPRARRPGAPRRRPARRDLAGQRRRPLHPPARPAPGPARPPLHRRRALPAPARTAPTGSRPSSRGRTRGRTTTTPGARRTSTSRCSAPTSPSAWSPRCTSPATRCSRSTRSTRPSPTSEARDRLVATYDHDVTQHEWSTGYRWDIVLTGSQKHPDGGVVTVARARRPARRSGRSSGMRCRSTATTSWFRCRTRRRCGSTVG